MAEQWSRDAIDRGAGDVSAATLTATGRAADWASMIRSLGPDGTSQTNALIALGYSAAEAAAVLSLVAGLESIAEAADDVESRLLRAAGPNRIGA